MESRGSEIATISLEEALADQSSFLDSTAEATKHSSTLITIRCSSGSPACRPRLYLLWLTVLGISPARPQRSMIRQPSPNSQETRFLGDVLTVLPRRFWPGFRFPIRQEPMIRPITGIPTTLSIPALVTLMLNGLSRAWTNRLTAKIDFMRRHFAIRTLPRLPRPTAINY